MPRNIFYQFYYKKSRIQQLKGFCNTIKYGTSKKASEIMGLNPSTITTQIKSLEKDLNIQLFKKQGRNILPTKEALEFYQKAIKLIQLSDEIFENFLLENDIKYQNSLRIACFDKLNFVLSSLIKYIAIFQKQNPKIRISLMNLTKDDCLEGLKNKRIDVAIFPFLEKKKKPTGFKVVKIGEYKDYWVISKNHPLAKKKNKINTEDIIKNNFAYIPEIIKQGGLWRINSFRNFLKIHKIKNAIDIRNGNLEILKNMVVNNMCISVLPDIYITKEDRENLICIDTEKTFSKRFYGCLTDKNIKSNTKKFIEFLSKEFNSK